MYSKTQRFPLFLMLFLLLLATSANAQTRVAKEPETAIIEVIGTAEQEVIPDEIFIAIAIRERYSGKEKITVEAQEEKLKNSLREAGINLENLFLSDAHAHYIRVRLISKDVMAQKDYLLKVGDAETVSKAFAVLEKTEIKGARISKVEHSRIDELRKETRIMAIKAAKDKSDYLLQAIGQQTGKALAVFETRPGELHGLASNVNVKGNRSAETQYYINGVKVIGSGAVSDGNSAIEFQKIKIESAVYVKFEIR